MNAAFIGGQCFSGLGVIRYITIVRGLKPAEMAT
jgi:hypothetical protein